MKRIREILAANAHSIGAFQVVPSAIVGEVLGKMGFDWVLADLQHGEVTWDGLLSVLQGIESGGAIPFVRVGWNDPVQIMRALDFGAVGIVVPMVSTAQDAATAAGAMRFPPRGIRSLGMTRKMYGDAGLAVDEANDSVFCLPMIETAEGLKNVEAIAATPGVDGLLVGPGDLALSLGVPLAFPPPPAVMEAMDKVIAACDRNKIVPACVAFGKNNAEDLLRRGMRLVAWGSDVGFIGEGARKVLKQAAEWKTQFPKKG